ncbi:MAG: hypothetical protein IPL40_06995 [Proteobacteria bacterium]|nr:hypothetical protein [Pseudomonadota bacterium]
MSPLLLQRVGVDGVSVRQQALLRLGAGLALGSLELRFVRLCRLAPSALVLAQALEHRALLVFAARLIGELHLDRRQPLLLLLAQRCAPRVLQALLLERA